MLFPSKRQRINISGGGRRSLYNILFLINFENENLTTNQMIKKVGKFKDNYQENYLDATYIQRIGICTNVT